jgi:AcrR family transcriptional regulator
MPRSQEQYNKIRNQKRHLILETALELFAEKGFHATSMNQIAKKAGISKGLAYNYFESKQKILDEIIKSGMDSIYIHFDLNHDGVLTEQEFTWFIRKTFEVVNENRRFWKLYSALLMQSDLADSVQEKYGDTSQSLLKTMQQFIASRGSKDPETDTLMISSLIKGALLLVITVPDYISTEKLWEKIPEACLRLIDNDNEIK